MRRVESVASPAGRPLCRRPGGGPQARLGDGPGSLGGQEPWQAFCLQIQKSTRRRHFDLAEWSWAQPPQVALAATRRPSSATCLSGCETLAAAAALACHLVLVCINLPNCHRDVAGRSDVDDEPLGHRAQPRGQRPAARWTVDNLFTLAPYRCPRRGGGTRTEFMLILLSISRPIRRGRLFGTARAPSSPLPVGSTTG